MIQAPLQTPIMAPNPTTINPLDDPSYPLILNNVVQRIEDESNYIPRSKRPLPSWLGLTLSPASTRLLAPPVNYRRTQGQFEPSVDTHQILKMLQNRINSFDSVLGRVKALIYRDGVSLDLLKKLLDSSLDLKCMLQSALLPPSPLESSGRGGSSESNTSSLNNFNVQEPSSVGSAFQVPTEPRLCNVDVNNLSQKEVDSLTDDAQLLLEFVYRSKLDYAQYQYKAYQKRIHLTAQEVAERAILRKIPNLKKTFNKRPLTQPIPHKVDKRSSIRVKFSESKRVYSSQLRDTSPRSSSTVNPVPLVSIKSKVKRPPIYYVNANDHGKECTECKNKDTPEWRRGPEGPKTVCNACGLFYSKLLKKSGSDVGKANKIMAERKAAMTAPGEIDRRVPAYM